MGVGGACGETSGGSSGGGRRGGGGSGGIGGGGGGGGGEGGGGDGDGGTGGGLYGGGGVAGGGDGVRSHLSHAAHWPWAHAHLVTHGLAWVTHQPSQRALLSSTTVAHSAQPLHSSEPHLHLVDQEAA